MGGIRFDVIDKMLGVITVTEAEAIVDGMGLPKYIPAEEFERVADRDGKIIGLLANDMNAKDMLDRILSGMLCFDEEDIVVDEISTMHEMQKDEV